MIATLLALFLITAQADPSVKHFHKVAKSAFPQSALESNICEGEPKKKCLEDFREEGEVWAGDVNDDGENELLVYPGFDWQGTLGKWYFLYQKRGDRWIPLYRDEYDSGWQVRSPRFDILPIVRDGYHDLRVAAAWCLKWDGKNYVVYGDSDYHQLSPPFFDSSDWQEAEIFWDVRYKGLKSISVEPQWFPLPKGWRQDATTVEVEDTEFNVVWVALFKGGVWGVRNNRAFLLLPQPAYKGSEQMELDGDWLVIHGEIEDFSTPPNVVARYNRRTHELRMERPIEKR
jgi:hypothetical protein